jgi:transposase, IS5 family
LHAKALPDVQYDRHTLATVVEATEHLTGCAIERGYVDKGYRGHQTPSPIFSIAAMVTVSAFERA